MRRTRTVTATLALALLPANLLAGVMGAAPAQAKDYDHVSVQDHNPDFCGAGFVVDVVEESDISWISRPADARATFSFTVWSSGTVTWTNAAGRVVTMTYQKTDRDLTVTDNGDGTRTIHAMNNRNEKYVGPDGATFRNRGPVWIDVVVADAGTPEDSFDDYWVDFLGFRQGGNWDLQDTWCDQMVTWLA